MTRKLFIAHWDWGMESELNSFLKTWKKFDRSFELNWVEMLVGVKEKRKKSCDKSQNYFFLF